MLLDPLSPLNVGEDLVNGKTEKFSIHLAEFIIILLEGNEFGGTDWSEVSWVAEEYKPFASVVTRDGFRAMGGLYLHSW